MTTKKNKLCEKSVCFLFVVTFFLPQHGTNCRTVLLLVGSRYSIFICFWGVLFFSCVSSQFAAQVTMTFSENGGALNASPTMYIFCLCVSKTMLSVQPNYLELGLIYRNVSQNFCCFFFLYFFSFPYSAV